MEEGADLTALCRSCRFCGTEWYTPDRSIKLNIVLVGDVIPTLNIIVATMQLSYIVPECFNMRWRKTEIKKKIFVNKIIMDLSNCVLCSSFAVLGCYFSVSH